MVQEYINQMDQILTKQNKYRTEHGQQTVEEWLAKKKFGADDFRGGRHPFKKGGDFKHPFLKD
ncbi:MAG: hypothetical protein ABIB79_00345 [archaeon]